jgi:FlaA1/EpsC-like NDP-sugar epimerase
MTKIQEKEKGSRLKSMGLPRKQIQFGLDLIILVSAFVLAYLLRFDFEIPEQYVHQLLVQLPYVVLLELMMLVLAGVYAFVWRYIGLSEVISFAKAALWAIFPLILLRVLLPEDFNKWRVPFSIALINTILAFGGILLLRLLRRTLYENFEKQKKVKHNINGRKRPILLIGAGRAGVLAAKEIQSRGDIDLEIKGFVDDELKKQGSIIHRVRVLGTTQDLPRLVRDMEIDHVIITIAQASRQDMRRMVETCERIPVKVRIIPGLYEILQGHVQVSRIRDVQIEDLLGRETVHLDEESLNLFLAGKTVMVTGAGGSIGSELARQVARFQPASLLLVERAENALFNIDRELRELYVNQTIKPLVADISDATRMRAIFKAHRPQVVLHAAAHKHVPLMEFNPAEAVKNNVLATRLLGEIAGEFNAEVFVLISTDKAVCPTSVMGATKRLAELLIQDLNQRATTHYVAVRFGNVIGSAGSVVPIFREQIRKGGPVTITDRRMKRYFMTIPEAAQLVLQAGAMGKSGKGGEVFILQMGEPVSILDLAEAIINLSGFKPHEEIKIVETGIRPGEKLYEELLMTEENVAGTQHPKIFINRIAGRSAEDIHLALERLEILSRNGHEQELRLFLNELLPEAKLNSLPHLYQEVGDNEFGKETAPSAGADEKPRGVCSSAQVS